jgi:hypothetical protein
VADVTAILTWLLANPTVIAIVAGILGAFGWGLKQRAAGAAKERARQHEAEAKARTIADEVENDVGALPGSKAREELHKWSR